MSKKIITKAEFNELSKVMDPLEIIQKYNIANASPVAKEVPEVKIVEKIEAEKVTIIQPEIILKKEFCRNCGGIINNKFCENLECKKSFFDPHLVHYRKKMNSNYNWYWILNLLIFAGGFLQIKDIQYLGIFPNICYLGWVEYSYAIYLSMNKVGDNQPTRCLTHRGAAWSIFFFVTSFLTINELWGFSKNYKLQWFILIYWILDLIVKLTLKFSSTDITLMSIYLLLMLIFYTTQYCIMSNLKSKINSRVNTFINQLS